MTPPEPYLLLSLVTPPLPAAAPEPPAFVGASDGRLLNAAGRWAVHGTARLPLLVWLPAQATAAQAAAECASLARGQDIVVCSRADASWTVGRELQLFSDAHEAALQGPAAHSSAKTRRLRTEAEKLEAFCLVVRTASSAADQAAFAEVGRAASKALRAKFGGGSITSAFAWLAGAAGREALDSVLTGEVELGGSLSIRQVVDAARLAQKAEFLREEGPAPASESPAVHARH